MKHKFKLELPERKERGLILKHVFGSEDCDYFEVAKYLQGKTFRDIVKIGAKLRRKTKVWTSEAIIEAFKRLEKDRKLFGESSIRIPEVKWADVGGLADAKEDIL